MSTLLRRMPDAIVCLFCLALMLCALLFPNVAAEAVRAGLKRCAVTLIPVLLPSAAAAAMLTDAGFIGLVGRGLRTPGRWLGLSGDCTALLLLSFLTGPPVCAGCAASLLRTGRIGEEEAARIVSLTANLSPAYLLAVFSDRRMGLLVWLTQSAAAAAIAFFTRPAHERRGKGSANEEERKVALLSGERTDPALGGERTAPTLGGGRTAASHNCVQTSAPHGNGRKLPAYGEAPTPSPHGGEPDRSGMAILLRALTRCAGTLTAVCAVVCFFSALSALMKRICPALAVLCPLLEVTSFLGPGVPLPAAAFLAGWAGLTAQSQAALCLPDTARALGRLLPVKLTQAAVCAAAAAIFAAVTNYS